MVQNSYIDAVYMYQKVINDAGRNGTLELNCNPPPRKMQDTKKKI